MEAAPADAGSSPQKIVAAAAVRAERYLQDEGPEDRGKTEPCSLPIVGPLV
jgi:hypothetical protein